MKCMRVPFIDGPHKNGSRQIRPFFINLLFEHIISDVATHYLDLLLEGQRFEAVIFRKFVCDYLANDDRYGTTYYWYYIKSYIWDLNGIVTFERQGQGHANFDSEYIGNGNR